MGGTVSWCCDCSTRFARRYDCGVYNYRPDSVKARFRAALQEESLAIRPKQYEISRPEPLGIRAI